MRDAVRRAGPPLRPRVLRRQGEGRRTHQRAVGRGRQARLSRGQHPHRVRRGRRRHHRAGHRLRGVGGGRLPAAAARGVARDRGHRDRPARHRGAAQAAPARPRRRVAEDRLRDHRARGRLNFHRLGTVARRDGDGWVLNGRKCYISGVDEAGTCWWWPAPRTPRPGKLKPALFLVPTDAAGLTRPSWTWRSCPRRTSSCSTWTTCGCRADALLGESLDAGLPALFAGLNPERITVAAMGAGTGRYAHRTGQRVHRHPQGLGRRRSAPTRGVAPSGARARAGGAGPPDDPEGGHPVRRRPRPGGRVGRQHGQVRRRPRPPRSPWTPPFRPSAGPA